MNLAFIWSTYYASVVSFQYHPGTKERLSLEQCADVADEMLSHFLSREVLWRGSDQHSPPSAQ